MVLINRDLPKRLPLLILKDKVLLPGSSIRIAVRDNASLRMIDSRLLRKDTLSSVVIGVVPRQSEKEDEETLLHAVGTAAVVVQVTGTNWPKPLYTLLVTGLCRFRIDKIVMEEPYLIAEVTQLDMLAEQEAEIRKNTDLATLADEFRLCANELVDMLDGRMPVVSRLKDMLSGLPDGSLPDTLASIVKASYLEKLEILKTEDLIERFRKSLHLLRRQKEGLRGTSPLKTNSEMIRRVWKGNNQKRGVNMIVPREGKRIGRAFDEGDDNEDEDDIDELERKIRSADLPEHAFKVAMKEFKRLKKMPPQFPEHATSRNYLEWMVDLPWNRETNDKLDISQARFDLDQDHYGLQKLKKRVIEYLSARKLKNSLKGPILCFVGPPGVGKTSVGRSIAHTLGREFHRISLGGICDQSDIRGHRQVILPPLSQKRSYLVLKITKLKVVAKLFADSQVLFIATANTISTIPPALLDRMELIMVPGYTQEEKMAISKRHLLPKQLKEHGLTKDNLDFPDSSLQAVISNYTREAGVRSLERKIGGVCRAVAVQVAETAENTPEQAKDKAEEEDPKEHEATSKTESSATTTGAANKKAFLVTEKFLTEVLGPTMFESEVGQRLSTPGVAVGELPPLSQKRSYLVLKITKPKVLFIATANTISTIPPALLDRMEEHGLTKDNLDFPDSSLKAVISNYTREAGVRSLERKIGGVCRAVAVQRPFSGDVMKESAQLALSWLRSRSVEYCLTSEDSEDLLERTDVHIHFPAGAVGKDGPSAGVTIVAVLVSLFSGRCSRSDTAMTGEITLRGLVLPVGGIKEKVLAAHRAGLKRVILPRRNEKDLTELPDNVKEEMDFVLANRVEDVLRAAFDDEFPGMAQATSSKL
ncbi:PREDICTED: lon protease homolog 2, peroxisomal-like [Acropora digitifera]|uniref:lon protease homolog 2, peroxisomal-like n=1 Tax=Acropora digitifera TaxID=70779 RepID=UPI00077B0381|nr:PREDICTED: lon protease homolog 2, peroxisomal-like [Acropora digitifera]